jgi:hypothetical protein
MGNIQFPYIKAPLIREFFRFYSRYNIRDRIATFRVNLKHPANFAPVMGRVPSSISFRSGLFTFRSLCTEVDVLWPHFVIHRANTTYTSILFDACVLPGCGEAKTLLLLRINKNNRIPTFCLSG